MENSPTNKKEGEDTTSDLHERLVEATENVVGNVPKEQSKNDLFGVLGDNLKQATGPSLAPATDVFMNDMKNTLRQGVNAVEKESNKPEEEVQNIQVKIGKESVVMIEVPIGTNKEEIEKLVLENETVKKLTGGKNIKKFHLMKGPRETTAYIFLD